METWVGATKRGLALGPTPETCAQSPLAWMGVTLTPLLWGKLGLCKTSDLKRGKQSIVAVLQVTRRSLYAHLPGTGAAVGGAVG